MAGFAEFLKAGLVKAVRDDNSLGDRSTYIGASDIGSCPRKVYLDKVNPQVIEAEQALIFTRGHLAEDIVRKGLDAKSIKYEYQKELSLDYIKAHLDFLFCKKNECIVVECKTSKSIPDTPYSSWILQIQLQMYLVKQRYQKDVRGYIVVMDMVSGEIKDFDIKYDEDLAKVALKRAKTLWEALQSGTEPEAEEQLYCSSCPHRTNCPIFCKGAVGQSLLEPEIKDIKELEAQKKALEAQIKEKKEKILQYLEEKGVSKAKAGEYIVSVQKSSSYVSLDTSKIKKEEPELYEKLISQYGKTINRSSSLKIK